MSSRMPADPLEKSASPPARTAEIVHEFGPFADGERVNGVSYDGQRVWASTGPRLIAVDPESGELARTLDCVGDAGTAFDGTHLYQIAESRIDKIDPATGAVVASIAAPGHGGDSGLAWAEGSLWVGQYRDRKILQIDPRTGAILRTIQTDRFVTGVTWVDGELWHGTWEGDESELRRIDPADGTVLDRVEMPPGVGVSGLESDGADLFWCGGGTSGKLRGVRRPHARAGSAPSGEPAGSGPAEPGTSLP
jgi:glutamine cyclotransferase